VRFGADDAEFFNEARDLTRSGIMVAMGAVPTEESVEAIASEVVVQARPAIDSVRNRRPLPTGFRPVRIPIALAHSRA
jgi:hypothetical protein